MAKQLDAMRRKREKEKAQKKTKREAAREAGTQAHIKSYADGVMHVLELLAQLDEDEGEACSEEGEASEVGSERGDEEVGEVDPVLWQQPRMPRPATESNRPLVLPEWAEGLDNKLGYLPLSPFHFIVTVAIGGVVTDAIVDSGGARSLVDSRSARLLGLNWQEAR